MYMRSNPAVAGIAVGMHPEFVWSLLTLSITYCIHSPHCWCKNPSVRLGCWKCAKSALLVNQTNLPLKEGLRRSRHPDNASTSPASRTEPQPVSWRVFNSDKYLTTLFLYIVRMIMSPLMLPEWIGSLFHRCRLFCYHWHTRKLCSTSQILAWFPDFCEWERLTAQCTEHSG